MAPESVIEWLDKSERAAGAGPVILRSDRDPLFGMSREAFESKLASALAGRARAAYFFGSYDSEDFGPDSDIDLIIVANAQHTFTKRAFEYADLLDIVPSLDILVYTPKEFATLTADPTAGFWQSVVETLRRLEIPAGA